MQPTALRPIWPLLRFSLAGLKLPHQGVKGTGKYWRIAGKRHRADVQYGGASYSFTQTELGILETERPSSRYSEMGPLPGLFEPDSRISGLPGFAFPTILLAADLPRFVGGPSAWALQSENAVDHIRVEPKAAPFPTIIDAYVAKDGRLVKFRVQVESDRGDLDTQFEFFDYSTAPIAAETFSLNPPLGFSPDALPRQITPAQPGETVALRITRQTLVVVFGAECGPSQRMEPMVKRLAATIPVHRATPSEAKALRGSGTPLFVLVGADRKVERVWFGESSDWESEIRAAFKK